MNEVIFAGFELTLASKLPVTTTLIQSGLTADCLTPSDGIAVPAPEPPPAKDPDAFAPPP